MLSRWLTIGLITLFGASVICAAEPAKAKRLLLVTHSGGFMHDSIGVAEDILKEIGPKHGLEVTCWRFTNDPATKVKIKGKKDQPDTEKTALEAYSEQYRSRTGKTVETENIGRINAETLKKFDCVLFFTTGNPVNKDELKDLLDWVKAGGAFAGTHCATDTLYNNAEYGDMIGAYFKTHPPGLQTIKIKVEDANHPAGKAFENGQSYKDEIYIFRDAPYSREKLKIILSAEPESFKPAQNGRSDSDYALAWTKSYGQGQVFYTAFGHAKEVWKDPKFQAHLIGGLKAAMKVPSNP